VNKREWRARIPKRDEEDVPECCTDGHFAAKLKAKSTILSCTLKIYFAKTLTGKRASSRG
jgi:hypothetical protein